MQSVRRRIFVLFQGLYQPLVAWVRLNNKMRGQPILPAPGYLFMDG